MITTMIMSYTYHMYTVISVYVSPAGDVGPATGSLRLAPGGLKRELLPAGRPPARGPPRGAFRPGRRQKNERGKKSRPSVGRGGPEYGGVPEQPAEPEQEHVEPAAPGEPVEPVEPGEPAYAGHL